MAVKRYDGSAWQTVAGLGAQGPAATSSSIATWVKTASGGETSLSGNDDNSQALSYTVGQELVFINGVLQKRGVDYTATTGTTITGLSALTANDIATVWTVNAFSVTGAIANSIVDAKGDILVGTGADTPGRLAVGSNNQVLTADSTTGTGLKWATAAAGGFTELATGSLSGTTTTISSISGSYRNLFIRLEDIVTSANGNVFLRFNSDSGTSYRYADVNSRTGTVSSSGTGDSGLTFIVTLNSTGTDASAAITVYNYANTVSYKNVEYTSIGLCPISSPVLTSRTGGGAWVSTSAINSVSIIAESTNTLTGTYYIYGQN